jgi:hypothetical protein
VLQAGSTQQVCEGVAGWACVRVWHFDYVNLVR